jgi:DNA-directed RNA polymerase specialized sigma24 family protein
MASEESVTQWIGQMQAGDSAAATKLWERYFHRLVGLARKKLRGMPRRAADEEDVALSAFNSFCRAAESDKFPELLDRNNLWRLLVVITARKAHQLIQHESRQKRGAGAVLDEAAIKPPGRDDSDPNGLAQVLSHEPTPEFAAQLNEQYQRMLDRLNDPQLRSVAEWKMDGYSNAEIAIKLGCVERSVERKLRLIRELWNQDACS